MEEDIVMNMHMHIHIIYVSGGGVLFGGRARSKRIFWLEFAIVLHAIINFMHPCKLCRNAVAHASMVEQDAVNGKHKQTQAHTTQTKLLQH